MESVIEGNTGEFFDVATPEVIAYGVRRLMENEENYDREFINQGGEGVWQRRFVKELGEFIERVLKSKD